MSFISANVHNLNPDEFDRFIKLPRIEEDLSFYNATLDKIVALKKYSVGADLCDTEEFRSYEEEFDQLQLHRFLCEVDRERQVACYGLETQTMGVQPKDNLLSDPIVGLEVKGVASDQEVVSFALKTVYIESNAFLSQKYNVEESEVGIIKEMGRGIFDLLVLYGFEKTHSSKWFKEAKRNKSKSLLTHARLSNDAYYHLIHMLLTFARINSFEKLYPLLKWKFAAYFAFHNGQEIPTKPDLKYPNHRYFNEPGYYCWGITEQFIHSMEKAHFRSFVGSTLLLKKGMPACTKGMVSASEKKTRIALTTYRGDPIEKEEIPIPTGFSYDLTVDSVKEQLERTVDEIFEGKSLDFSFFRPKFPSTSANYNNSRSKAGAVQDCYDLGVFDEPIELDIGIEHVALTNEYSRHYGHLGKKEDQQFSFERRMGYDVPLQAKGLVVDLTSLNDRWWHAYHRIFKAAIDEVPIVKTVGLTEPLKVRVITKGPPLTYTALSPLQKFLWSTLKTIPVFELIGKPLNEDMINWIFQDFQEDDIAVSGDYVASTDNLRSWVSECIANRIMLHLQENIDSVLLGVLPPNFMGALKVLFIKSLTRHIFDMEDGTFSPQREGQLMGSVTSFVVLCIANAAICRRAMELANRRTYKIRSRKIPLRINGDDTLFKGNRRTIRSIWESLASFIGLESSVGKTYFSDRMCTLNSTLFYRDDNGVSLSKKWYLEPQVNMGLVENKSKDGSPRDYYMLGSALRKLKETCPVSVYPNAKKMFILRSKDILHRTTLPWFLPEWCGGLGLPIDSPSEISDHDRKMASYIRENYSCLKPAHMGDIPQWQTHQIVLRELRQYGLDEVPFREINGLDLKEQSTQIYSALVVKQLFNNSLSDLYKINHEHQSSSHALKHNMSMFRKASKNCYSYEMMPIHELEHEKREFFLPMYAKSLNFIELRGEGQSEDPGLSCSPFV